MKPKTKIGFALEGSSPKGKASWLTNFIWRANTQIRPYKLCLLFCVLLLSGVAFSQVKEGEWKWIYSPLTTELNFDIGFGYDDNIFKYSPEDIGKFVNNESPRRFARIESYDDFVTHGRVTADFRKRLWMGEPTRLRFKYARYQYAVNPIKNYQSLILNIRQEFLMKNFFQIGYLLIPQFYIRDYYDDDFRDYKRCDFREHLIALKIGREILQKMTGAIIYKWEVENYDSYFDEYDTRANLFGASISQKFLRDINAEIEYLYKDAKAKACDEEGETPLTSDESDISYRENAIKLDLEWDAKKRLNIPLSLNVVYEYKPRVYTTQKSIEDDPFHRDRKDREQTFAGGLEFKVTPTFLVNILYTYEKQDTDSPKKAEITEVKNYTNHIISAGLVFMVK